MTNLDWMLREIRIQARSLKNQISGLPKEVQEEITKDVMDILTEGEQDNENLFLRDKPCTT